MSYQWKPVQYARVVSPPPLSGTNWSTTQKVLIGVGAAALGLLFYTNLQFVRQGEKAQART